MHHLPSLRRGMREVRYQKFERDEGLSDEKKSLGRKRANGSFIFGKDEQSRSVRVAEVSPRFQPPDATDPSTLLPLCTEHLGLFSRISKMHFRGSKSTKKTHVLRAQISRAENSLSPPFSASARTPSSSTTYRTERREKKAVERGRETPKRGSESKGKGRSLALGILRHAPRNRTRAKGGRDGLELQYPAVVEENASTRSTVTQKKNRNTGPQKAGRYGKEAERQSGQTRKRKESAAAREDRELHTRYMCIYTGAGGWRLRCCSPARPATRLSRFCCERDRENGKQGQNRVEECKGLSREEKNNRKGPRKENGRDSAVWKQFRSTHAGSPELAGVLLKCTYTSKQSNSLKNRKMPPPFRIWFLS
nr:hypothetical protein TgIb.2071 [Toxoplasma gondii RH]